MCTPAVRQTYRKDPVLRNAVYYGVKRPHKDFQRLLNGPKGKDPALPPPPPKASLLSGAEEAAASNPLMQLPSTILSGAEYDFVQSSNADAMAKRKAASASQDATNNATAAAAGYGSTAAYNANQGAQRGVTGEEARARIGSAYAGLTPEQAAAAKKKKADEIDAANAAWRARNPTILGGVGR